MSRDSKEALVKILLSVNIFGGLLVLVGALGAWEHSFSTIYQAIPLALVGGLVALFCLYVWHVLFDMQ